MVVTRGSNCKALTGKHFGVLDRWLLTGGGRTLKFDCTGNEVPVGYEELARGWSNESEKVKYCEGLTILTLLVLLGITLHLNHTVNSPGGLFISNPFEGDDQVQATSSTGLGSQKLLERHRKTNIQIPANHVACQIFYRGVTLCCSDLNYRN